jgi:3'(2'), 5'-bisphosphate nucleotidase
MYGVYQEGAFEVKAGKNIPLKTREFNKECYVLTLTRSENSAQVKFLESHTEQDIIYSNSAIKFMFVAAGEADIYPRFSPTSEWDTAAGQCIIEAAGGMVLDWEGNTLEYNRKESLLNVPFIAAGDCN